MLAAGPDKAKKAPILMGSPAKDAGAATAQHQRNDDGNSRFHDRPPPSSLDKTSLDYISTQSRNNPHKRNFRPAHRNTPLG